MQLAIGIWVAALATGGSIALIINRYMRRRTADSAQYSRRTLLFSGGIQLFAAAVFLPLAVIGESGWRFYFYLTMGIVLLINGALVIRGVIRRARDGGKIKWHGY